MSSLKEHCEDCVKAIGEPFEEVHIWLDAFFNKSGSFAHRDERHHMAGVEEVRKMWGDKAAEAAKIHIMKDWGFSTEGEIPKHNVDAMFFRTVTLKQMEDRKKWELLSSQQRGVVRKVSQKDMFNH